MNAKIKYTNEPMVIKDFLPSPAELAFNEEAVKNHTQYQRMIRRLVDAYVDSHSRALRHTIRPSSPPT